MPVPKERNTHEENETIKGGQTPKAWEKKPAKNRQKDKDARWTKKHGRSFYGYKNHVNADATRTRLRPTLLLSQGVPMLLAGDEFGRTK